MASLFSACKSVVRNNSGGTFNIGGYDIDIEYCKQQDIDDDFKFDNVAFGDEDESKILLVAGSTITIPEGYTLTPDSPKKSLVILCNNLINNGTISMYQKAPNVLPHDYFIIEKTYFDSNKDLVIPAYAKNRIDTVASSGGNVTGKNGNNGTNRNCGSGGTGCNGYVHAVTVGLGASGSGYAFGGGAGSGGSIPYWTGSQTAAGVSPDVDTTYPMRGSNGGASQCMGGVGNPPGNSISALEQNFGCGGRIIIFCCNFENNGTITVNGTATKNSNQNNSFGGASGAGAVDLFYTTLITEGIITANGGENFTRSNYSSYTVNYHATTPGKGGDGSITLSQWTQTKLFKTEAKYFSQANINYLLTQLSDRIKESHMGE